MGTNQNPGFDIDFSSFGENTYPKRGEKIRGRIISASLKIPSGAEANKDNRMWQVVIAPNEKEVTNTDGSRKTVAYQFQRQGAPMENMLVQKSFTEWKSFKAGAPLSDLSKSSQLAFRDLKRVAKACRYDKLVQSGEQITVSPNVVKAINDDGVAKIPETFTPPKGISLDKIASGDWSDLAKMMACFVGKEVEFVVKTTPTNDHEVMNIYDPESREAAAAGVAALNKTDEEMDVIPDDEADEIRKDLGLNGHTEKGDETPFEV